MDLSAQTIYDIIHPTCILSSASRQIKGKTPEPKTEYTVSTLMNEEDITAQIDEEDEYEDPEVPSPSWGQSALNPKNRIETLVPPKKPLWRIDGCTAFGTQFYAIPTFLDMVPPMRIDVFIPEQAEQPPKVRSLLSLSAAFHTKDAARVSRLGIASYIIRALNIWTMTFADFTIIYKTLPFGSRIIFENLPIDLRDLRIRVAPAHHLEGQMPSVRALAALWGVAPEDIPSFFPPSIDIFELDVVEQVHDSTSIVRYHDKLLVFKAITSHIKYIYHELHNLILIKPHPNVISRPRHIVTKKCRFGSKRAVLGFTLEYHAPGTLRDILPMRRLNQTLQFQTQLAWCKQITSALIHLHKTDGPFYPDLRLDNIVLTESEQVVLVDFEQRGVWCEFGPPEINAIEYILLIAETKEKGHHKLGSEITSDSLIDGDRCSGLLERMLPKYWRLNRTQNYSQVGLEYGGYNIAWLSLTPREREAAEVYMLGRVIYCIFEGVSAPNRATVWQSYRCESDVEFPERLRAPKNLSRLIDRCTRGRRPALASKVGRVGDTLRTVVRKGENTSSLEHDKDGKLSISSIAANFWQQEVQCAVDFLEERLSRLENGHWNENYYERPCLEEVMAELVSISWQASNN